jgi:hypothetical protein
MVDRAELINVEFMNKQYKIILNEVLTRKIIDIEENTDEYLEEYLNIMGVEEIDVKNPSSSIYIVDIWLYDDLPYNVVVDRVAKCINSFIRDNDYK